jgi:preprotein translocase subunit SecA
MFRRMNDGIKEETVRQLFLIRRQYQANAEKNSADAATSGATPA